MFTILRKAAGLATESAQVIDIKTALPISVQTVGEAEVKTVDARKVHQWLGVGSRFADWIKDRITYFEFIEGRDYYRTNQKVGIRSNVTQIDYLLTLSMAKELCMVERNDQGKKARQYFIECERVALSPQPFSGPLTLGHVRQLLELAESQETQIKELTGQVEELKPAAEACEQIIDTNGVYCIRDAAHQLGYREKDFKEFLERQNFVYRRTLSDGSKTGPIASADMFNNKYLAMKTRKYGSTKVTQTYVTTKGLFYFERLLKKHGVFKPNGESKRKTSIVLRKVDTFDDPV